MADLLAMSEAIIDGKADAGGPRASGTTNVSRRFDRYNLTDGYNRIINERQFGQFRRAGYGMESGGPFLPASSPKPDTVYSDQLSLSSGGLDIELRHAKGE